MQKEPYKDGMGQDKKELCRNGWELEVLCKLRISKLYIYVCMYMFTCLCMYIYVSGRVYRCIYMLMLPSPAC